MCYKIIAYIKYEMIRIVIVLIVLIVIIAVLIIHANNKHSAWYFNLSYNAHKHIYLVYNFLNKFLTNYFLNNFLNLFYILL